MGLIAVNACDLADAQVPQEERNLFEQKKQKSGFKCDLSVLDGFFKQSDVSVDDSTFDWTNSHFGLDLKSWDILKEKLSTLNKDAEENVKYKLVFCARHGQGYHNKVVDIVGLKVWDDHYSHLNEGTFNGEHYVWGPDPFLTEKGESQARLMKQSFQKEIQLGCPLPTVLFTSPFTRSSQTLALTWEDILVSKDPNFKGRLLPNVKEDLRETIGLHTCDKRSTKSVFLERLGAWGFQHDDSFPEEDVYYKDDWREPLSDQAIRAYRFLDGLYDYDDEVVYCASHAGEIKALLMAANHRTFTVPTAGMIPMLLKLTKKN